MRPKRFQKERFKKILLIQRILFLLNRSSATGHGAETAKFIQAVLKEVLGEAVKVSFSAVDDHPAAAKISEEFLNASEEEFQAQYKAYQKSLEKFHTIPGTPDES